MNQISSAICGAFQKRIEVVYNVQRKKEKYFINRVNVITILTYLPTIGSCSQYLEPTYFNASTTTSSAETPCYK